VVVYEVYVFMDRFMPLFMVGFIVCCCITGLGKGNFGDKAMKII